MIDIILSHWNTLPLVYQNPKIKVICNCYTNDAQANVEINGWYQKYDWCDENTNQSAILQHFHHLQLVFYWTLGLLIRSAVADENQFLQSVDQQIVLSVFAVGFELIPRLFVLLSLCHSFVFLVIALIYWEVKLSHLRIQIDELLSPFPQLFQCAAHTFISQLTNNGFFSKDLFNSFWLCLVLPFFHHFILLFDWSSLRWAELRRSVLLLALIRMLPIV